mmetsp:Transcript_22027/g.18274  ORF Transcript_22027/g.18274 Transcript_22027/m.18274 type:complete len:230 (-) Transcript_22027:1075-1764(-)
MHTLHNLLLRLGGSAHGLVHDHFSCQLAPQNSPLHRAQELLRSPITRQSEIGDGCPLLRPELVAAGNGSIHRPRRPHYRELFQFSQGAIRGNFCREQTLKLQHCRSNNLVITFSHPVSLAASNRRAWREHELQHRLLGIVVLRARHRHVRVHRQQRRAREAQVVHRSKFLVKPQVEVDDWDTLKLVHLAEIGHLLPRRWLHSLQYVHRHRRDILVSNNSGAVAHFKVLD